MAFSSVCRTYSPASCVHCSGSLAADVASKLPAGLSCIFLRHETLVSPCDMKHSVTPCDMKHSFTSCDMKHSSCDMKHSSTQILRCFSTVCFAVVRRRGPPRTFAFYRSPKTCPRRPSPSSAEELGCCSRHSLTAHGAPGEGEKMFTNYQLKSSQRRWLPRLDCLSSVLRVYPPWAGPYGVLLKLRRHLHTLNTPPSGYRGYRGASVVRLSLSLSLSLVSPISTRKNHT